MKGTETAESGAPAIAELRRRSRALERAHDELRLLRRLVHTTRLALDELDDQVQTMGFPVADARPDT